MSTAVPQTAASSSLSGAPPMIQRGNLALDSTESLTFKLLNQIGQWAAQMTPKLAETLQSFWGKPLTLQWIAVSPDSLYFWRQEEFFVTQAGETTHLRLSDSLAALLLRETLGDTSNFELSGITTLESELLTALNSDILQTLLKRGDKSAKAPKTGEVVHLVWLVQNAPQTQDSSENTVETGKLILSIPASMLRLPPFEPKQTLSDEALLEACTIVELYVGKALVPIADLQSLEIGDTVVLDDSSKTRLALIGPNDEQIPFEVSIQNASKIDTTNEFADELTQDKTMSERVMSAYENKQALWDSLMIDVSAKFDPIRMPLANVKQMSEGLIVEIGDMIHHQMTLMVDGKPLAKGELVIVGDTFGLRVTQMLVNGQALQAQPVPEAGLMPAKPKPVESQPKPEQKTPAPQPEPSAPPPPPPQAEAKPSGGDDFLDDDFGDDDDW